MILFVVLAFLGVLRHSAGSTVGVDCDGMMDFENCGVLHPCEIKLTESFQSEFFQHELVRLTYHQDANASEPSCSDSGCEQYTSNTFYYVVLNDFDIEGVDHVILSKGGRAAICDELCSLYDSSTFSGYCQTAGQCLESTEECHWTDLMIGSATVEKNSPADIVIECDIDDEENCGTVYKPCNAKFHASSGFSQNDVVSMAYRQRPNDNEESCQDTICKEYASEIVYYTVVDTTTAAEGIVILGPKGFAPACLAACAVVDGGPFSGYCQRGDDFQKCAEFAGQCEGSTDPTGKAYFHLEPPPPPITGTVNGTIGFACDMADSEYCGTRTTPCTLRSNSMFEYEFFKGELVAMTYHQDANASEPSCSDSGCEQFTSSSTTFYKINEFDVDPEYHVLMSTYGRSAFCEERCSTEQSGSFSGYCQNAGQCLHSTDTCEEDTVMPGLASFEKISIDVVVDCDLDDDDHDCGTADKPCNAILHASSGFTQNDLVSMVYWQLGDREATHICTDGLNGCHEYQSSVIYYTVSDTTTGVEGQVIMGGFAFAPACNETCGVPDPSVPPSEDDQVFSGFCQIRGKCHVAMSPCEGFHNNNPPLGKAYFVLEEKGIPTPTTTRDPTEPTEPTGTGTATGTTEPTTAMTAALAVVAVLALWA